MSSTTRQSELLLFKEVVKHYRNPQITKLPEDNVAMEDVRNKCASRMAKISTAFTFGGYVIGSLLKPKRRFLGSLVGIIIGYPMGVAYTPVKESLQEILNLPTPFGNLARDSAAEILPQDHPLNLQNQHIQSVPEAQYYKENKDTRGSLITHTNDFIDDHANMQKEPTYDQYNLKQTSTSPIDQVETTFDMSSGADRDKSYIYADNDNVLGANSPDRTNSAQSRVPSPQQNLRSIPQTRNTSPVEGNKNTKELLEQAAANRRARLQRQPHTRHQSYNDNVMEAPRGKYED